MVGAHLTWLLWFFLIVTFPISFPLSAILDKLVGVEDGEEYNKTKMKNMFETYERDKLLDATERKILSAALEWQDKTAKEVMTPLEKCFTLNVEALLDKDLLKLIYTQGYSRVPIYEGERENIVGLLMTRDLILVNPDKQKITIR